MVKINIRQRNNKDKNQLMLQIINTNGRICNINLPLLEYVKIHLETGKVKLPHTDLNIIADMVFINLDWTDLDLYNLKINVEDGWYNIECNKRLDSIILEQFDKILHPKCENCGEPLSHYKLYTEDGTFNPCSKCGHMNEKKYRKKGNDKNGR